MPIVTFHLAEGAASEAQCEQLMSQASAAYAEILESPIERVRVFINVYSAKRLAVGGAVLAEDSQGAPYFEYLVLQGRPASQRQALMSTFTTLVADVLAIDKGLVRGRCVQLDPEDWGIGGTLASELRKKEIDSRARQTS